MKIERYESGYRISDLYIAASLLCDPAFSLLEVKNEEYSKKRVMFIIEGNPDDIDLAIKSFFNSKFMVDAHLYKTKVQDLKSRIYAKY